MICKNCGANNENSNKFCLNCGKPLDNNDVINNPTNSNSSINNVSSNNVNTPLNNQVNNNVNNSINNNNMNNIANNGNVNNNKNNLIPVIVIGAVIILIVVVGLVSNNVMSNSNNQNNNTTNNNVNNPSNNVNDPSNSENNNVPDNEQDGESNSVEQEIEEDKNEDYEELEISKMPKNDNFKYFGKDWGLTLINNNETKDIYETKISLENNIGYIGENDNKIQIPIENIDKLYVYASDDCDMQFSMFILNKDGEIFTNSALNISFIINYNYEKIKQYSESFVKFQADKKFNDIYYLFIKPTSCNPETILVFETTDNEKILKSGLNYNDIYHTIGNYGITQDNYLYDMSTNKLVYNSKVKTILYKGEDEYNANYIIYFEDDYKQEIVIDEY